MTAKINKTRCYQTPEDSDLQNWETHGIDIQTVFTRIASRINNPDCDLHWRDFYFKRIIYKQIRSFPNFRLIIKAKNISNNRFYALKLFYCLEGKKRAEQIHHDLQKNHISVQYDSGLSKHTLWCNNDTTNCTEWYLDNIKTYIAVFEYSNSERTLRKRTTELREDYKKNLEIIKSKKYTSEEVNHFIRKFRTATANELKEIISILHEYISNFHQKPNPAESKRTRTARRNFHGDLKPENIFFIEKLSDNGEKRLALKVGDMEPVLGTMTYVPRSQLEPSQVLPNDPECGKRRDAFALKMVALELKYLVDLRAEVYEKESFLKRSNSYEKYGKWLKENSSIQDREDWLIDKGYAPIFEADIETLHDLKEKQSGEDDLEKGVAQPTGDTGSYPTITEPSGKKDFTALLISGLKEIFLSLFASLLIAIIFWSSLSNFIIEAALKEGPVEDILVYVMILALVLLIAYVPYYFCRNYFFPRQWSNRFWFIWPAFLYLIPLFHYSLNERELLNKTLFLIISPF